ncbi:unnamed protein product [Phytophthora lilii]|uniref:Unnamed protein product n=1 Tax=Phytophthora lilii TaxID=2077276 RepID=A0A9W6T8L4_9STRA|nr:unnamed protein product [Phytophthora lilii]
MIQHFVHNGTLQHAIVDLVPASFAASSGSSFQENSGAVGTAFWMADLDAVRSPPSSLSSSQSSILCTKEARVQNEINVVFYETLLTLHHLLVFLKSTAKIQRATRDRQNYIAASNRQMHQNRRIGGDFNDVPAEKQADALAEKLLEKYRFLMDSIVDIRLVRMAETSVALVQFVLNHFATKTTASQLHLVSDDNQQSHSSDGDFHNSRRKRLEALGSFLDDYHAVAQSRAETRSILFGTERTIELPVPALSYATGASTNAAMERLLNPGTTNRIDTVISNGSMRLEYLEPSEPPSSIRDEDAYMKPLEQEKHSERTPKEVDEKPAAMKLIQKKFLKGGPSKNPVVKPSKYGNYDSLDLDNNNQVYEPSLPSSVEQLVGRTSPTRSIQSDIGANLLKTEDDDDSVGPLMHSDHVTTAVRSPRAIRKAFQASVGARRTANECDACIGCNDVCTNERCFFCAEKEYQLKVAFAGSSVATGPTVRQAVWQHRAPSSVESSFNVEREYSSCEMKRHQCQRSCWIRVDDSVYDVTDLLGVHPGGAQVLLEAAQHGGDCGPILKTHPPAARDMLTQYRLGRYYDCSKS